MEQYTACFFGHRKIKETEALKNNLYENIENLIVEERVDTFLFGSNSAFDDLCLEIVTKLKEKHPHIRRIYVRSSYPFIDERYRKHLLQWYEDTYYPESMGNAGKASYVERNQEMISRSKFCIVYYDEKYLPPRRKNSRRDVLTYQPKSGTQIAYKYAKIKKRIIYNMFEQKISG